MKLVVHKISAVINQFWFRNLGYHGKMSDKDITDLLRVINIIAQLEQCNFYMDMYYYKKIIGTKSNKIY